MVMPTHDGKRQLMVPGERFMTEMDTSCETAVRHASFFTQSPVLSTQSLFSLTPEH